MDARSGFNTIIVELQELIDHDEMRDKYIKRSLQEVQERVNLLKEEFLHKPHNIYRDGAIGD